MKRQYASIDIARYVSALLVVCIHTFPFLEISETFNTYFIHTVCRLAVPFFFTTSGFFFFRNYDSENEDLNETRLKKALIRLFRIYFGQLFICHIRFLIIRTRVSILSIYLHM